MYDPLDFETRRIFEKFSRTRLKARAILFLESAGLHLWRLAVWILFFCGLWLFDIPALFSPAGPVAAWLIFTAGMAFWIYADIFSWTWPGTKDAYKRLEEESGLHHRPLTGMNDTLANPEKPDTRWLWAISRENVISALPKLKTGFPRPALAARDRYALRMGIFLFFLLGFVSAGPSWNNRILSGLTPFASHFSGAGTSNIHLWITPPDYTRLAQIALTPGEDRPLSIPEGSMIKASVYSPFGAPVLSMGDRRFAMTKSDARNYVFEAPVNEGSRISISKFFIPMAGWDYKIIPDTPPEFSMTGEPETLPSAALRFHFKVLDDYGLENLHFKMTAEDPGTMPPLGTDTDETRTINSPPDTEFEFSPVYDLASHPWAGRPVLFHFAAEDHKGQRTGLEPIRLILPQKRFTHPVAQKLIAIRSEIAGNLEADYKSAAIEIEKLLFKPFEFQDDKIVFLAIRAASSRLFWSPPDKETALSVLQLLWDTALKIEDGNLPLAARDLKRAQDALKNALQDPQASPEHIGQLMNDLREAMAEYFSELQRALQKQAENGESAPVMPSQMFPYTIDAAALSAFLDQLEAQMLAGDMTAAENMLSQLQRLMDMMNPSLAQPMPEDMKMMSEGLQRLQELIERQQNLLERTAQQIEALQSFSSPGFGDILPQNSQLLKDWGLSDIPPAPEQVQKPSLTPDISMSENRQEQESIRHLLGEIMLDAGEALGQIPENMGLAEQEMRSASAQMELNKPAESLPHQELALTYLKDSQQQLSQQLMQRMQRMMGLSFNGGMNRDPLGRPYRSHDDPNGLLPGSKVEIPSETERNRAHEILNLLRRRSGEFDRPELELDYYRRLLRQF